MSKYHSRSPDEFKKYIEGLSATPKKRNWRNIIYFVDILLLMFVFYMVSKLLNPAMDIQLRASTRLNLNGLEFYFAKSNTIEKDLSNYFFFIKNTEDKEREFKGAKGLYVLINELGEECFQREISFHTKLVPPTQLQSIPFSIPKISKDRFSKNCKSIYRKPPFPRTVDTVFDFSEKYRIDAYLKLEINEEKIEFILTDEIWK
jgi:hypothetical protein